MSAPRFAWVLNLDAELELSRKRHQPSRALTAQLARFRERASGLLAPGDVLLPQPGLQTSSFVGRAWCPTPLALREMRQAGIEPERHPDAGVLRAVNHRAFAHRLRLGLPQQRLVRTMDELQGLVAPKRDAWLLKRPLSFAGRGHCRVFGALDETARRWVTASLRDDLLLAEPLVRPTAEFSLHGFLRPDGASTFGRVCAQDVNARGVYQGVRPAEASELLPEERTALTHAAQSAATALSSAGYFGPFGIDAYRFETLSGDGRGFCALSEINARYTMAFATGFPEPPGSLC